MEPLKIGLDAQMHRLVSRNRDGRREGVGLRRVRRAGHHAQIFADGLVVREMQVMKLRTVVVTNEPGCLLEMFRLEFDDCGGADAMRLLPSRDECLPEQASNSFAAKKPQKTGTRAEAENLLWPGRAQPLEI